MRIYVAVVLSVLSFLLLLTGMISWMKAVIARHDGSVGFLWGVFFSVVAPVAMFAVSLGVSVSVLHLPDITGWLSGKARACKARTPRFESGTGVLGEVVFLCTLVATSKLAPAYRVACRFGRQARGWAVRVTQRCGDVAFFIRAEGQIRGWWRAG